MEFRFADIGEGITEGEIVKWLVKEGDRVKADQVLCKIETDKAVVEMPSPVGGTIKEIKIKSGVAKVGDVLVIIEEAKGKAIVGGKKKEEFLSKTKKAESKVNKSSTVVGELEEARDEPEKPVEKISLLGGARKGAGFSKTETKSALSPLSSSQPKIVKKYDLWGHISHVPLGGIRKATAENMSKSWREIPHVTHFDDADITELWNVREKEKQ